MLNREHDHYRKGKSDRALFAVVAIALTVMFFILPPFGLHTTDEGVKFIQMENFALHGTFALQYPGEGIGLDKSHANPVNASIWARSGEIDVMFPPLFTWMSSLFYALLGARATHFLPLLALFLSLIVISRIGRLLTDQAIAHYGILLTFLLASPALFYSLTFYEHTPALFLVLCGLYFLVLHFKITRNATDLFLSSLFIASAVFFRTEIILLIAAFGIAVSTTFAITKKKRELFAILIGLSLPVAVCAIFNHVAYGTLPSIHYVANVSHHDYQARSFLLSSAVFSGIAFSWVIAGKIEAPSERVGSTRFFLSILFVAFALFYRIDTPVTDFLMAFPLAFVLFLMPNAAEATDHGQHDLREILVVTSLVFLSLLAVLLDGPFSRNARFALPVMPFIMTLILLDWRTLFKEKGIVCVCALLLLIGAITSFLSIKNDLLPFMQLNEARVQWLSKQTEHKDVIIFENEPLLRHAGPLFFNRIFIVEESPREVKRLVDHLSEKGFTRCFFLTNNSAYESVLKSFEPSTTREAFRYHLGSAFPDVELQLFRIPLDGKNDRRDTIPQLKTETH